MADTSKPEPPPPKADPVPLKALAAEKAGALNPQDSVQTAGDRMREHHAAVWPVAEDRKLVGVVDEKNPDWRIGGRGHDPRTWRVGQIMSRDVVFCYEDQDCTEAQKLMEAHGLRHLPVVDRQMRIVGIFSREEIRGKTEASAPEPSDTPDIASGPATEA
jgi:CBS domain-containing protein